MRLLLIDKINEANDSQPLAKINPNKKSRRNLFDDMVQFYQIEKEKKFGTRM